MRIILVAGMPGAGKEELLNVARSMGLPFLRMGDIVREFHASSGAEAAGLSVGQVANREREVNGKDIWARRAIERMYGDVFLVDGCRSRDEVNSYLSLGDDVVIVSVHAPRMTRYRRLVERGRDDAPADTERGQLLISPVYGKFQIGKCPPQLFLFYHLNLLLIFL